MIKQGFTLIEILVAMTILFAVVTTGYVAYQTALVSSERANQATFMLSALPYIQQEVHRQLLAEPLQDQGEGEMLSVRYYWSNQPGTLTAAPNEDDPMSANTEPRARFRLHDVQLELRYKQAQQSFEYQELTWLK